MTSLTLFWFLYCKLWTYLTPCSSVSIVDFEEVNGDWEGNISNLKPSFHWLFLYPLKTLENQRFSTVFRGAERDSGIEMGQFWFVCPRSIAIVVNYYYPGLTDQYAIWFVIKKAGLPKPLWSVIQILKRKSGLKDILKVQNSHLEVLL